MSKERPESREREGRRAFLRTKKGKIAAASALSAIILMTLFFPWPWLSTPIIPIALPPPEPGEPTLDLLGDVTIQGPLIYDPVWNECTQDWRPRYPRHSCDELNETFGLLPEVPRDLGDIAEMYFFNEINMYRLILEHPDTVASQYWLQPEFYPGWSNKTLAIQRQPPKPTWTPFGWGFYNGIASLNISRDGPEAERGYVDMYTLFYSGWGTDTWQGLHLYPNYPTTLYRTDGQPAKDASGSIVVQNPTEVPFSVSITNPSNELYMRLITDGIARRDPEGDVITIKLNDERRPGGQFFLLPPSHPRLTPDWARLLRIRISFNDLRPGVWFFSLEGANPSFEVNQEHSLIYGQFYVPSGSWLVTRAMPAFQGVLIVR